MILIDVESTRRVRDLRSKAGAANQSARKLLEQAQRVKKQHQHMLTATLDASKEDQWFDALRQLIFHLQVLLGLPDLPNPLTPPGETRLDARVPAGVSPGRCAAVPGPSAGRNSHERFRFVGMIGGIRSEMDGPMLKAETTECTTGD